MPIHRLHPRSLPDGTFAAAWFDDAENLWDEPRLHTVRRLAGDWMPPSLQLYRPERGATPVLFNPNALAVSTSIREALARFDDLEFLPVSIAGHGTFHVLHVVSGVELPAGSDARIASVSGNLVELQAFARGFVAPAAFFSVLHPQGAAARGNGKVNGVVYLSDAAAECLAAVAGDFVEARRVATT